MKRAAGNSPPLSGGDTLLNDIASTFLLRAGMVGATILPLLAILFCADGGLSIGTACSGLETPFFAANAMIHAMESLGTAHLNRASGAICFAFHRACWHLGVCCDNLLL